MIRCLLPAQWAFLGNGKLSKIHGEIFYTLREAQVLIEEWRQHYNRIRPHSALGYRPPAEYCNESNGGVN